MSNMSSLHPTMPLPESADDARIELTLLVSASLDGMASAEDTARMQAILKVYPELTSVASGLSSVEGALRQWESTSLSQPEMPSLWPSIREALVSDSNDTIDDALSAWETCSAYYDDAMPDADKTLFESQLRHSNEANDSLKSIDSISTTYQAFGQRLEAACDFDAAESVVASSMTDTPLPESFELLSAYWDDALDTKTRKQAIAMIDSDSDAKVYMQGITAISDGIQHLTESFSDSAPDVWPAIQAKLLANDSTDNANNVVPFSKTSVSGKSSSSGFSRLLRFAVPLTSVAAVALMFLYPLQSSFNSNGLMSHKADSTQKPKFTKDRTVIASAPAELMGRRASFNDIQLQESASDDAGTKMAHLPSSGIGTDSTQQPGESIPSAEAYMLESTQVHDDLSSEYTVMMGEMR